MRPDLHRAGLSSSPHGGGKQRTVYHVNIRYDVIVALEHERLNQ